MLRVLAIGLIALGFASPITAQQPDARPLQARGADDRARLEQRIRQDFADAVRRRVGLDTDQMAKLGPIATRYEQRRRQLQIDERGARLALRAAIRRESTSDAHVDSLLQRMIDVQKRRVALVESEQRELAAFMSPLQRAKYLAMQEQIRQRLEQARQRRLQSVEGDSGVAPASRRGFNRRPPQ